MVATMAEDLWGVPTPETISTLKELSNKKLPARRFVVVIIHYENPQEVRELVSSIQLWSEKPERIIVADNSHPRFNWEDLASSDIPGLFSPHQATPASGKLPTCETLYTTLLSYAIYIWGRNRE
jgi:hypothetical protein